MNRYAIDFSKLNGLVPAVAQDYQTKEILMVAFVNEEAFEQTVKTGKATYWSRSRQEIWCKGNTSGNFQKIKDILIDCDNDCLVYLVEPMGKKAACHTNRRSCFYRHFVNQQWEDNGIPIMD
ncbi:MAG: phosphoribosyl-AMP cyclohydrolase [Spirochaetes bacterium]|nr:phosphoribosyl-AMP cyclohydrolase [Spirochaetota bacterium]